MRKPDRYDAWQEGESYDAYMGRWSRAVAPLFLDWLDAEPDRDWLDLGCGTGALTSAIAAHCRPRSVVSLDLSETFIAKARASLSNARVDFRVGSAEALDLPPKSRDVVVSGLLLNFLQNKESALTEARRIARSGGLVGFYVWDYPGHGMEFVDAFWKAATSLDDAASRLDEARRFPFCTPEGLTKIAAEAGLTSVEWKAIDVPTVFDGFEDYWQPFTLGAGPAPGYCASLSPEDRKRLKDKLRLMVAGGSGGSIAMTARAWAVRSRIV